MTVYNDPITAAPRTTYQAVHSSGHRALSDIRWIILHDEEAPTAESAARYFTNPNSGGSAHECVDGTVCFQTLTADKIPWGAPGANQQGYHIEQAGYAKWTRAIWLSKKDWLIVQRTAYRSALACKNFLKVAPVFLDYRALRANRKGITTHAEVTKAFPDLARKYGSHTDPGFGWPRDKFMVTCVDYYQHLMAHGAKIPVAYKRPYWFYDFAAWWLGIERFKEFGPHDPKHRPPNMPAKIPAAVWKDLEVFMAAEKKAR